MSEKDTTRTDVGPHEAAVTDFVERVEAADIDGLSQLILFGSVARRSYTADSDVDVLAIVDTAADEHAIEETLRDLAYDTMLERGVVFSIHAVTESTYERRSDHPFFETVTAEGHSIYG